MNRFLSGWARTGTVVATAALFAACSHPRPNTAPEAPPLAVPPPPPRAVEPARNEPPPPVPLPSEPEGAAPPRPAPRAEPARPEPPKPEAAKPEVEPKPDEGPQATTLQTTPAGQEGAVEQTIRNQLGRASGYLAHIDYQRLNLDARTQYDTAKRLIKQAEDALRARNLVFARTLADKAAALAAQLAGK